MARAGVFIGVDQTGTLLRLNDAAAGAQRMHNWALAQGMADKTHAKLITDAGGKVVTPDLIYDAIMEIIDGPGVDQLILYFAGHGVNINRNEHWLLTDAPRKTSAAVNVTGSVDLARFSGIQHVVIISDACRVAPEGIQAQNVRGVDVFPNDPIGDKTKPVDQFFACALGKTAAELKDPAIAAGNYTALYTNVLLDALTGTRPEVLEPAGTPGDTSRYVKPLRLETYLEDEVPLRVRALKLEKIVNQNPDALIIASQSTWLSRIDKSIAPRSLGPPDSPVAPPDRGMPDKSDALTALSLPGASKAPPDLHISEARRPTPETLRTVARKLVHAAVEGNQSLLDTHLLNTEIVPATGAMQLVGTASRLAVPFGPDHFETQCGIKVRGARIEKYLAPQASAELLGAEGDILRLHVPENRAVSVLLRFVGGFGTVIPAIPDFIAALTFDEGELVDVAYEPSGNTWRWGPYMDRAKEVRALRGVAASASQNGNFRLDQADAMSIARKMQYAKGVDPTLAVYAAYAYYDLQAIERIRDMSSYLRSDIGITFFDLALLGRALINKSVGPNENVVPFVPLLSQGWALLRANRVKMHPKLDGIESTMKESLWSLFNSNGLDQLSMAMQTGEVR